MTGPWIEALLLIWVGFLAYVFHKRGSPVLIAFLVAGWVWGAFTELTPHLLIIFKMLGLGLLFFFTGLEYNLRQLWEMRRLLISALIDAVNILVGLTAGRMLGFSWNEAFLLGVALYPSSTAFTLGLLREKGRMANPEAEKLIGILLWEDIFSIAVIAVFSPSPLITSTNLWIGALTLLMLIGWSYHQRAYPLFWQNIAQTPFFVFFLLGMILLLLSVAETSHLSEILWTFLLGVLITQRWMVEKIENQLSVLRELSIGLYFFHFAWETPFELSGKIFICLGLALVLGMVKIFSTYAALYDLPRRARIRAAFSFTGRGEFSLIFAQQFPFLVPYVVPTTLINMLMGMGLFLWAPTLARRIYPSKSFPLSQKAPVGG
ncbi:MAG: cation:proton antiporter [Bacteroidia bacterium]